jgi:hypothetical protein
MIIYSVGNLGNNTMNRLAIFAHWNEDSIIDKYVVYRTIRY